MRRQTRNDARPQRAVDVVINQVVAIGNYCNGALAATR
jgi:hypothetical protein